jgi:hypothetical protein
MTCKCHSGDERESWFALFSAGLISFIWWRPLRGWLVFRLGIARVFVIGFVLLRSFFLSSLENPEPRYVLECFPVVLGCPVQHSDQKCDDRDANHTCLIVAWPSSCHSSLSTVF